MDNINKDMARMVAEMREVGELPAPSKGGSHNNLLRYNEMRERILEKFLSAFDAGYTLTPLNELLTIEFDVVDTMTGTYPDWERIAREESWAKGLVYCDIDGVAIREDGSLILLDECGNCVSCPPDRFEIRRPPEGEANA